MLTKEIINFANHLADLSGKIAKKYFRLTNGEKAKLDDSPVTMADQEIEETIRAEIKKTFPTHGIIGEEYENINESADFVWIIDPIDGTSSFIIGRPLFGVLIALTYKGKVILGIMHQPITGERWVGIEGEGSWLNGEKIQTRNCVKLSDAVMCTSSPHYFIGGDEGRLKKLSSLTKYQRIGGVIYGGDCYSYGLLASGFVDIVIDPGLKIYDYAALLPIMKMAGAVVTDWEGKELGLKSDIKILACASKELHEQAMKILCD